MRNDSVVPLNPSYLDQLNPRQRRAVEHGIMADGPISAAPLLVIAGAGSGKTNTLAHRVAHLIANGADPRRILLLTFSRRAAASLKRASLELLKSLLPVSKGVRLLRITLSALGVDGNHESPQLALAL